MFSYVLLSQTHRANHPKTYECIFFLKLQQSIFPKMFSQHLEGHKNRGLEISYSPSVLTRLNILKFALSLFQDHNGLVPIFFQRVLNPTCLLNILPTVNQASSPNSSFELYTLPLEDSFYQACLIL